MKIRIKKGLPKYKLAWLGMILGLLAILEFPILFLYSFISQKMAAMQFGPGIGFVGIIITLCALAINTSLYRKGERSWAFWVGYISSLLIGAFWLALIIAEVFSIVFKLGF